MNYQPNTRSDGGDQVISAVLGPTNTGKTYLAMDRMLGHASGMMGFPLRLLARENYERAVAAKGAAAVALVTGEEKILPATARYFICTVESMPLDRDVAFVGIDEIQLAADRERGHVFTDRLLNCRGRVETMFLGAETIRPLIRKLVPEAEFVSRPRFSKLTYAGPKKLTRLPRRSAVVAFSVSEVYGIADLIRRQRGGTAVVMGALSPRARNAQVALYQSGEVDYLVATDAIGMGLNMDVDHVAFASLSKFDGRSPRALTAPEMAQIAGRAGRHMNDGTFGVTADARSLDPEIVTRIESHEFPALKTLSWRNTKLNFMTVPSLLSGLRASPPSPGLVRPPPAEDQLALEMLATDPLVSERAKGKERVGLLWDICQVPDFRKLRTDTHSRLLLQVFNYLSQGPGVLPEDWVSAQVERIDRSDGDIHALMDRIAAIRVWTYLANRPGWMENALHWQGQTRAVEDRLSDALHGKLIQQFIDSRTAHLVKKLKGTDRMAATVKEDGRVEVDGHFIGDLDGMVFKAEVTGLKTADRAIANSANSVLIPELTKRANEQLAAEDTQFTLNDNGQLIWKDAVVATLTPGNQPVHPRVNVRADDRLDIDLRDKLKDQYQSWIESHIKTVLAPLIAAESATLAGAARGLAYQVVEALGAINRKDVESQVKALSEEERKALASCSIRFGVDTIYVPDVLKAEPMRLRAILWKNFHAPEAAPALPPSGRVSFPTEAGVAADYYRACGFRPVKGMAYRVDMLERFTAEVRRLLREKATHLPPEQLSPLGINADAAVVLLNALGFKSEQTEEGITIAPGRRQRPQGKKQSQSKDHKNPGQKAGGAVDKKKAHKATHKKGQRKQKADKPIDPDSPFAKLQVLVKS